jgi:hypothetical protein
MRRGVKRCRTLGRSIGIARGSGDDDEVYQEDVFGEATLGVAMVQCIKKMY